MDSGSKVSRDRLESLRAQGLDEHGEPKTSYWKARLEAEEGRVLVAELKAEVEALRASGSGTAAKPAASKADAAASAKLEAEVAKLRKELDKAKSELQKAKQQAARPKKAKSTPAKSSSGSGDSSARVVELEEQLRESEVQKQRSQETLMGRIRGFQAANGELQKQIRETMASKDHWKEKAQGLETVLADLRLAQKQSKPGDASPIGHYPTIQALLEWLGVSLDEGRVIAVGEAHHKRIQIEVRKGHLARVLQLEKGNERTYQTLPLSSPANDLLSILLPCQRYYEHWTDPRVFDACRLLGRPLPTT